MREIRRPTPEFYLPPQRDGETRPTAAELGALPAPKSEPLSADQIKWRKAGAWRRIGPELLDKPDTLGKLLTENASVGGSSTHTITRRLTALEKNGRVAVVSTYQHHGNCKTMLAHPELSAERERIHRSLQEVLKDGWKPIASLLLDKPTRDYRRRFNSIEDFEKSVGAPFPRPDVETQ
jgi:hypothetical protein